MSIEKPRSHPLCKAKSILRPAFNPLVLQLHSPYFTQTPPHILCHTIIQQQPSEETQASVQSKIIYIGVLFMREPFSTRGSRVARNLGRSFAVWVVADSWQTQGQILLLLGAEAVLQACWGRRGSLHFGNRTQQQAALGRWSIFEVDFDFDLCRRHSFFSFLPR